MPNKAQFVDMLAERLDGDRKRAAAALDAMIDSVYAAVSRGERVAITGFGVFERRDRAARTARNPATGASVNVPASKVPAFRPGAEFKSIADGAFEILEQRAARTQSAVASLADSARDTRTRAVAAVVEAQGIAQNAVADAVEAVRDAPGKALAAVTNSAPVKVAKKAQKRGAGKALASNKSGPATRSVAGSSLASDTGVPSRAAAKKAVKAAKKSAEKATAPAKKAAKKSAEKATAPAKKAAKKAAAPAKKAAKKSAEKATAPAKKAAKKSAEKATAPAKKAAAKKAPATKSAAKAPATKAAAKKAAKKAPAKKAAKKSGKK